MRTLVLAVANTGVSATDVPLNFDGFDNRTTCSRGHKMAATRHAKAWILGLAIACLCAYAGWQLLAPAGASANWVDVAAATRSNVSDVAVGRMTEHMGPDGLRYLMYLPERWRPRVRYPILVFLHGRGESGGFDVTVRQSLPSLLRGNATFRSRFPFIALIPQCPWSCAQSNEWTSNVLRATTRVVNRVVAEYGGDPARVALAGQSMGGNGAWEYAAKQSGLFASLTVVCGYTRSVLYSTKALAARLDGLPVWVFHAQNDIVIPVEASDEPVAELTAARGGRGDTLRYTRYASAPGPPMPEFATLLGHGSYELAFRDEALYAWMLRQRCESCGEAEQVWRSEI